MVVADFLSRLPEQGGGRERWLPSLSSAAGICGVEGGVAWRRLRTEGAGRLNRGNRHSCEGLE